MAVQYEVCFLDHGGHVYASAKLDADDDAAAVSLARRVYPTGIGSGYRIMRGLRGGSRRGVLSLCGVTD
jgi:hypothetical protein